MKKIIYGIIGIVILASIVYSFTGGESQEAYSTRIKGAQDDRVKMLLQMSDSPLRDLKNQVASLPYFAVDRAYQVTAKVEKLESPSYLDIPTNTGESRKYTKYGYATFELKGTEFRLLLLREFGKKNLLLAFADETSGAETYGGGRYIDLEPGNRPKAVIDFNLAYNPFCAYSGRFSCPLPPKENYLPVAIEAGEKVFTK